MFNDLAKCEEDQARCSQLEPIRHELGRMPFGKYTGAFLIDVPSEYLRWVLNNCDFKRCRWLPKRIKKILRCPVWDDDYEPPTEQEQRQFEQWRKANKRP